MEPLLKIAAQVPALAVLAYLVYSHGQQLKSLVDGWQKTLSESELVRSEAITKINDECHSVQRDSFEVMNSVSNQLARNTDALTEVVRQNRDSKIDT